MSDYQLYNQLINHLLNSADPIPKKKLANHLGVSSKTVKRLKDAINDENAIIEEYEGKYGGYYIANKNIFQRIPFTQKDYQTLLNIKSLMEKDTSIFNQQDCIRTLEKISKRSGASEDIISSVVNGFPLAMPKEQLATYYDQLLYAIENCFKAKMIYHKPNSDKNESYTVQPFELTKRNNAWYFNAVKDDNPDQKRNYKLNRIVNLEIMNEKFLKTLLHVTKGTSMPMYKVKLKIRDSGFVDEIIVGNNPKITYLDSKTLILETEMEGEYITKGFILSLGKNCEVLEPVSLRQEIIQELLVALDQYK